MKVSFWGIVLCFFSNKAIEVYLYLILWDLQVIDKKDQHLLRNTVKTFFGFESIKLMYHLNKQQVFKIYRE